MSVPLEEALKQVKLEPGLTTCRVNGWDVQMLVRPVAAEPESLLNESDIMLDAWVEFPDPSGGIAAVSRLGEPDWPDVPEIPPEDEPQ